jgi:3-mercaptopyruvate sulfurtransferase SseA
MKPIGFVDRVARFTVGLLAVVGLLASVGSGAARASAEPADGPLVSAAWLERHRQGGDIVLLDASPAQAYTAGHLPGAISVDFMSYGFPEPPLAELERRYQSWGLSPGRKVVIYDLGGTFFATRLFYALYYHGFPLSDLHVLDGGLAKWRALGLPVTREASPATAKGTFRIASLRDDARVMLPEFLEASGDPKRHALIEANGPDQHFGETAFFDRAGHVPNAVLMPFEDFYNADKTFKSPDEIRRMLAHFGVRPDQQVHTHCGGGVAASVPFFAVRFLAGYPRVKLFQESQMGWLADPRELPFWTYGAPSLVKDGQWVRAWGGRMMRMYGVSRVSIVDVRAADDYKLGHVPFALPIPADVFRRHLADPIALARVLGAAGVDATHEAVVVSGAGLTKEAALAFVSLERAGQAKTSILLGSLEQWVQRGYAVSTEPTVVGPKTAPFDTSVVPTDYPTATRTGVIIAGATATRGVYPKVYIASGTTMPTKRPEGTVVHLPYTELVGADGTPKPAKDLWKVLSKAGVPRYAELVAFADDPAEAAVTYVALRLLGFPDAKVLVD